MLKHLPNVLKMENGTLVQNAHDWQIRREEILFLLRKEIYGFPPPVLAPGQGKITEEKTKCCAGHAVLEKIEITVQTEKGPFQFPVNLFMPTAPGPHPLFLLLNFRPDEYDMYYPAEEIIDQGFALAVIYYQDVTSDRKEAWDKLAACFARPADGTGYGALTLWAYAASRALDYLLTRPDVDKDHIGVIGHSRLGKTALWCGAQDERIRYVFSNDSGCAGAALETCKHKGGETTKDILRNFPYWFCENYEKYNGHPEALPFDQHFLMACHAPGLVYLTGATGDAGMDPMSEFLSCCAASEVYKVLGKQGLVHENAMPAPGQPLQEGEIGFHIREGGHCLTRTDWQHFMNFFKKHM